MEEEGEVVLFTGDLNSSLCHLRKDSMISVMKKYKKMKVVAEIDTIIDNEAVYQKTKELLTDYPNLRGLVTITGGAHGAAKAIQELNLAGKVRLLCYDYDNDIIDYIRKSVISVSMGQDPFGQGHDPLIYLYNYLVAGEKPEDIIHTRIEIMDIRNVN
jgi:methyl-accepting chemotaxis protein/ribose transport system substrate-binding protein